MGWEILVERDPQGLGVNRLQERRQRETHSGPPPADRGDGRAGGGGRCSRSQGSWEGRPEVGILVGMFRL